MCISSAIKTYELLDLRARTRFLKLSLVTQEIVQSIVIWSYLNLRIPTEVVRQCDMPGSHHLHRLKRYVLHR